MQSCGGARSSRAGQTDFVGFRQSRVITLIPAKEGVDYRGMRAWRTVLDTNVLVSAFLFSGQTSRFVPFMKEGTVVPLVSKEILDEYLRVLSYPRFSLAVPEIRALLYEEILVVAEVVQVSDPFPPPAATRRTTGFLLARWPEKPMRWSAVTPISCLSRESTPVRSCPSMPS